MICDGNHNGELNWDSEIFSQAFFLSSIIDQSNVLNLKYGDAIKKFQTMKNSHSVVEEIYLEEQENLQKEFRRCENLIVKCRAGVRRDILSERMDDLRVELECFEISFRCWEVSSQKDLKECEMKMSNAEKHFLDMEEGIVKLWICKHWNTD